MQSESTKELFQNLSSDDHSNDAPGWSDDKSRSADDDDESSRGGSIDEEHDVARGGGSGVQSKTPADNEIENSSSANDEDDKVIHAAK